MSSSALRFAAGFGTLFRKPCGLAALLLAGLLLSGCATTRQSTPVPSASVSHGIRFERATPAELPSRSVSFPANAFVLLPSYNALNLLNPVPFGSHVVDFAYNRYKAGKLGQAWAELDAFTTITAEFEGSPLLLADGEALTLEPIVFLQECSGSLYRVSLAAHLHNPGWSGRYMVHLPDPYAADEIDAPDAGAISDFRKDLQAAAQRLRTLIERDARGELGGPGEEGVLGSNELADSRILGLITSQIVLAPHARILEKSAEETIVRIPGNPKANASSGGLFYGLHAFSKDQIRSFRPAATAAF